MDLNYLAIFVAAVAQFVVGAIWYTPLFGGLWGRMHGFDKLAPETQKQMQGKMMPLLATQFVMSVITSGVLALFIAALPAGWNVYGMAGFFWLGFIAPTEVSAVIFGGTEPRWVMPKIAVSVGGSFATMMVAAAVLANMA
jgi:hypothetical protein